MATLRRAALLGLATLLVATAARAQTAAAARDVAAARPAAAAAAADAPPPPPRARARRRPPPPAVTPLPPTLAPEPAPGAAAHADGADRARARSRPRPEPFYRQDLVLGRRRRRRRDRRNHPALRALRSNDTAAGHHPREHECVLSASPRPRSPARCCSPPAARTRSRTSCCRCARRRRRQRRDHRRRQHPRSTSPRGRPSWACSPTTRTDATIDQTSDNTLSVGFSGNETGNIKFVVDALEQRRLLDRPRHGDQADQEGRHRLRRRVRWRRARTAAADGGAPDAPEAARSPAAIRSTRRAPPPASRPAPPRRPARSTAPADERGAAQRVHRGRQRRGGTACNTNADCQPGTQCFDYTTLGCAVKVCLRFCNTDADCTAVGAGGGGPGSFCQGPVMCPGVLTAYHTCTFNCDPRAIARPAPRGGCPTGSPA